MPEHSTIRPHAPAERAGGQRRLREWMLRDWLGSAFALVVIDQIVKVIVLQTVQPGQVISVAPFFNLVLVYNPGAAFSFLAGASGWQREFFIGVALVASMWIVWMLRRYPERTLFCVALTLILGGAIGNLIDRLWLGSVIDFVDLHLFGYHWPAFNVADSAITCGAAALIWDAFRGDAAAAAGGGASSASTTGSSKL
ncbi:MAG: lipoprotein signal peptidase [Proteobacteria bacterium]|nr:lipoprotein signal peptidase [Burkholderiales bacterium]